MPFSEHRLRWLLLEPLEVVGAALQGFPGKAGQTNAFSERPVKSHRTFDANAL